MRERRQQEESHHEDRWRGPAVEGFHRRERPKGGTTALRAIVRRARTEGLAGATVLRGIEGLGAHSRMHTAKILRLSQDLPIVVEIVDLADRIQEFLPFLDQMVGEGMITLEKAHIIAYRHEEKR